MGIIQQYVQAYSDEHGFSENWGNLHEYSVIVQRLICDHVDRVGDIAI